MVWRTVCEALDRPFYAAAAACLGMPGGRCRQLRPEPLPTRRKGRRALPACMVWYMMCVVLFGSGTAALRAAALPRHFFNIIWKERNQWNKCVWLKNNNWWEGGGLAWPWWKNRLGVWQYVPAPASIYAVMEGGRLFRSKYHLFSQLIQESVHSMEEYEQTETSGLRYDEWWRQIMAESGSEGSIWKNKALYIRK